MTLSWVCAEAVQFIAMTAAPATAPTTLMRAAFPIMRASLDRMRFANTGRKISLVLHRGAHARDRIGGGAGGPPYPRPPPPPAPSDRALPALARHPRRVRRPSRSRPLLAE